MDWYKPQNFQTNVVGVFYSPGEGIVHEADKLILMPEGIKGDSHSGLHTLSTVREKAFTPKGSYVLNTRQGTLTSQGECDDIATALDIDSVTPADLMSNIHLEGMNFLSGLPAGTMIRFADPKGEERQSVLYVTGINNPCFIPKQRIEERLGAEGSARGFEKEAMRRRGLLFMVWKPGFVKRGDVAYITTPPIAYQNQLG